MQINQSSSSWMEQAVEKAKSTHKPNQEISRQQPVAQEITSELNKLRSTGQFSPELTGPNKVESVMLRIFNKDPKALINELRTSDGPARYQGLVSFQSELNKLNRQELGIARDHLVALMADPQNGDDELLGVLLQQVNHEIDSRQQRQLDLRDVMMD